jgi:hypothetical protein
VRSVREQQAQSQATQQRAQPPGHLSADAQKLQSMYLSYDRGGGGDQVQVQGQGGSRPGSRAGRPSAASRRITGEQQQPGSSSGSGEWPAWWLADKDCTRCGAACWGPRARAINRSSRCRPVSEAPFARKHQRPAPLVGSYLRPLPPTMHAPAGAHHPSSPAASRRERGPRGQLKQAAVPRQPLGSGRPAQGEQQHPLWGRRARQRRRGRVDPGCLPLGQGAGQGHSGPQAEGRQGHQGAVVLAAEGLVGESDGGGGGGWGGGGGGGVEGGSWGLACASCVERASAPADDRCRQQWLLTMGGWWSVPMVHGMSLAGD